MTARATKKKTRRDVMKGCAALASVVATPAVAMPKYIEGPDHNHFVFTFYFDVKGDFAAARRIQNSIQRWIEGEAFLQDLNIQVYIRGEAIRSSKVEAS
jgi:hypothetical protein